MVGGSIGLGNGEDGGEPGAETRAMPARSELGEWEKHGLVGDGVPGLTVTRRRARAATIKMGDGTAAARSASPG